MKKLFLTFNLLLTLSILLASCATAPQQPQAEAPAVEQPATEAPATEEAPTAEVVADEPVELTWLGWSLNAIPNPDADYIGKFQADHPNVSIVIENYPWGEHGTKSMTLAQNDELQDVLQVANVRAAPLDDLGALLDLRPIIDKESEEWKSFILPGGFVERNGRIIGIRWSATPYSFVYNKKIFSDNGLEPPTNFAELADALQVLRDPDAGTYGSTLALTIDQANVFTWLYMAFYMTQKGGYMLDDAGMPAFNNDLGVEAVEYFLNLIENDLVTPGAEATGVGVARELLCAEQIAVIIDGSFMKEICRASNPDIDMGFVHLKDVTGGHSTGGGFWSISASTEHPEKSWEFVKFLSSPYAAKQYFLDSGQAPMMDLYSDPDIEADEFARVAGEILKDPAIRVMPILPESPELERILVEEIQKVLLEDKDVRQALDDAAAGWSNILSGTN